jgi:hypothetical protein
MIYIPKEFMVGFQRRVNNKDLALDTDMDNEYVLGFATYKDEKGKIRCETSWNNWRKKENPILTWPNDPIEGFNIVGYEKRSSGAWNSTGRSVFDVVDPRGFVLQINSGNLVEIIRQCKITQGVIQDKCLWAWEGQNIMLVPQETDLYKKGIETFRLKNQQVSLKDINLGDRVKFQDGKIGVWLGGKYITQNNPYPYYKNPPNEIVLKEQKRKIFVLLEDYKTWGVDNPGLYLNLKSSWNVSEIVEKAKVPWTSEQITQLLTKHLVFIHERKKRNKDISWKDRDKSTLDEWNYDYDFKSIININDKKFKDKDEWIDNVKELEPNTPILIWDSRTEELRKAQTNDEMRRNRGW